MYLTKLRTAILTSQEDYSWSLTIDEDNRLTHGSTVHGWVRYVDSVHDLSHGTVNTLGNIEQNGNIDDNPLSDSLALLHNYQEAELWGDAIGLIVKLKTSYPNETTVSDAWNQIMSDLNLEASGMSD